MAKKHRPPAEPCLTFHGAARTVTGSMHLLDARGASVLLDCGFFQGSRAETFARNAKFPFRPKDIDAVVLSHAHIDHCGNLPNLLKQGFVGPIFCTPATRALVAVMLGDAAKIQEEDAAYLNRRREPGTPKVEPLYEGTHVYRTLLRLKAIDYDTPTEILRGLTVTFVDAGHLLGSAMVNVSIDAGRDAPPKTLTFTGDVGRPGTPILRPPSPIPPADTVVCESTYGGHAHEPIEETAEHLGEIVRRTVSRGGKLVIPAFSVGRTQTIVYYLHRLMMAKRLPDVPIYVDSPMAVRATEVFRGHPECFDAATRQVMKDHPDLFGEERITYVEKVHDSIALNRKPEPCVIISASGMCEAGRVVHHIKHNIDDKRSTILIVGYQAEHTLGRRIVRGDPEIKIFGRAFPVKAEVAVLNGLSSHADQPQLLDMFAPLVGTTKAVRLVHGEPSRAAILEGALRGMGFGDVAVPEAGDRVML